MRLTTILAAAVILAASASASYADEHVSGYTRSNGTYVNGYTRSSPDSSYNNNYNTQGNTNPSTGESGTQRPTYNDRTPEYNTRTSGDAGYAPSTSTRSNSRYGN